MFSHTKSATHAFETQKMCHKQYLNAWNLTEMVIKSIKYTTDYVLLHTICHTCQSSENLSQSVSEWIKSATN